jgi:uncharacterized protein YbcI
LPKYVGILFILMNTQGEIERAVSEGMSRFEQEYMGPGPQDVRAHLIDDLSGSDLIGAHSGSAQTDLISSGTRHTRRQASVAGDS